MKRIIILSISLFIALSSFSQNVLTYKNNAPAIGDSSSYIKIPYVAPGDAGPDQVWDFSGITIRGDKILSKITAPQFKDEKSAGDYNIILEEDGSKYHFNLTGDYFMETGGITPDYTLNFSDPIIKMVYPFAYGKHFTDNFAGQAEAKAGQKVDFSGVLSVTADAYGTLVLPDRAYQDVLRIRTESSGLEISQCNSVESKTVRYLWYAPGCKYPVMNISVIERRVSGKEADITRSAVVWAGKIATTPSVKDKPPDQVVNDDVSVVVYPNPFSDRLNYHYFLHKSVSATITLTDVTGKMSALIMKHNQQSEGLYSGTINASEFNLNPGVYYLRFIFDQQVIVKKVVKL